MNPAEGGVLVRHCLTCGLDTASIDPLYCPDCGTFLENAPRPRQGRPAAEEPDEVRAARLAYGLYVRRLKVKAEPPGELAVLETRRGRRAHYRDEVHRLTMEGKSIARIAVELKISKGYVSELRREKV
jgi:hypothetical protein